MSHTAEFYEIGDVLYFHFERPGPDYGSVGYEYNGIAEERHKKDYKQEYEAYLRSKEPTLELVEEPKTEEAPKTRVKKVRGLIDILKGKIEDE